MVEDLRSSFQQLLASHGMLQKACGGPFPPLDALVAFAFGADLATIPDPKSVLEAYISSLMVSDNKSGSRNHHASWVSFLGFI